MMQDPPAVRRSDVSWHFSPLGWAVLAGALVLAYVPFARVITGLLEVWNREPEYSHAILIPFLSLFLVWRERAALMQTPFRGSWLGVWLTFTGMLLWGVAELSTIYVIEQYAFLVVLYGLVLALGGARVFRRLWMPLLMLAFLIPLPAFFANSLSLKLQLLSSAIGVGVIRLFGISVYLDGNVIDLGALKLQVAEACNGLRYLYPLMTLAFMLAYLFRAAPWKRVLLFVASMPLAVLMNSLRIGLIGVAVEYWGVRMAQGVLHDFEGWVVFMISLGVLLLLAAALVRIGRPHARLRDALTLDGGPAPARATVRRWRELPRPFLVATALAALATALTFFMPDRTELVPGRQSFAEFPLQLAGWNGVRSPLDPVYQDQLKLSDYLLSDYYRADGAPINVWIAYYDSQRKGQSAHSPRSCLPGGGWEFASLGTRSLAIPAGTLRVNRGVILHGEERQLLYYWFQQRGRVITNEYAVKWYIFWDALTRNRSDGALVRLITPLPRGMTEAQADRELSRFAATLSAVLPRYVPG